MSLAGQRWLLCSSRGERFGLELRWVRQIDYRPAVLPLPTAVPPLTGLLYWRGRQVPALSLDRLLGHPPSTERQAALMLEVEGRPMGLLVGEVGETMEVDRQGLFGIDGSVADRAGLVTEAFRSGQDLVFRLNVERLVPAAAAGDAPASQSEQHEKSDSTHQREVPK